MLRYVLLLGSNIDKEQNLPRSIDLLDADEEIRVIDRSAVFESEPVGAIGTPRFRNQALLIEGRLDRETLQERIRAIEEELGRKRTSDRNAPRTIDIDVILEIHEKDGVVPDPDSELDRYHHIALPAAEVAGHVRLPDGQRVSDLARALGPPPDGFVRVDLDFATPPRAFLEDAAAQDLPLTPDALGRLGQFVGLLLETNRRFNLTAVRDPDDAWHRHILDSLTLVHPLSYIGAESVIDVGSGGGLPGIPLAIALPETRFTLLEATGKKVFFLESAIRELDLGNVTVVQERAETAGHDPAHRERYDAVLARALGPLRVLLELTLPLATPEGAVLAIKGEKAEEEIKAAGRALKILHARVVGTERTATGTIVLIEKQRPTPKKYPRRPGEPKRAPLGG